MNTDELILYQNLLSICQYDNEMELKNFFHIYPQFKFAPFIKQEAFILACEEGNLSTVKYLSSLGNELYPRKNGVMPILLKQVFEKGITKATFNTHIDILDYLLFHSGVDSKIGVKGRVNKLLRISQSLESTKLTEYLFTHPDLVDESLSHSLDIENLLYNSLYKKQFNLSRLFLTLPQCNKYYQNTKSWQAIVNQYIYQSNITEIDFFLQLDDFKKYVDIDFVKNSLINILGIGIPNNYHESIKYLIFNLNISEKDMFQRIEKLDKHQHISETVKLVIKDYFQKLYLNNNLEQTLSHNSQTKEEKIIKKIKL